MELFPVVTDVGLQPRESTVGSAPAQARLQFAFEPPFEPLHVHEYVPFTPTPPSESAPFPAYEPALQVYAVPPQTALTGSVVHVEPFQYAGAIHAAWHVAPSQFGYDGLPQTVHVGGLVALFPQETQAEPFHPVPPGQSFTTICAVSKFDPSAHLSTKVPGMVKASFVAALNVYEPVFDLLLPFQEP